MKKIVLFAFFALALTGCNQKPRIDQSKMCVYSTAEEARQCTAGEMSWFRPSRWGNEQLPLNVAGAYCDFNYAVMYNNAGVICIFTDKRLSSTN